MHALDALTDAVCEYIESIDTQLRGFADHSASREKHLVCFLLIVKGIAESLTKPMHALSRDTPLLVYVIDLYRYVVSGEDISDRFVVGGYAKSPFSIPYIIKLSTQYPNHAAHKLVSVLDMLSSNDGIVGECSNIIQKNKF